MRVVAFGTFDVRTHPRMQVLIDGLRAHGDDVEVHAVPLGVDTAQRVRILQRPWLAPVLLARIAVAWWRLWRDTRGARGAPRPDAVVVGYMGHADVHLARRRFRGVPIALDHLISFSDTAVDRGAPGAGRAALLARVDAAAVRAADLVVVDTAGHAQMLPAKVRGRAVVVAVGAPEAWYRPPARRQDGILRVVFFGLFTPLQGTPTIGLAVARLAAEPIAFTFCGNGQDLQEAKRAAAGGAAATWHDWVPSEDLPDLVAGHDVCLGIFGTGPKALRVVPNKVFQGAAAGCAVVTSDTPPQRAALGDAGIYVEPGDAEGLAHALLALARDPAAAWDAREAAYRRAREAFTPRAVVEPLRAALLRQVGR